MVRKIEGLQDEMKLKVNGEAVREMKEEIMEQLKELRNMIMNLKK